ADVSRTLMDDRPDEGGDRAHFDTSVLVVPRPRGFCAGVVRAIDIVSLALQQLGPPIYVRKEIVHNRHVVAELAERGAVFVDELDQVPNESVVVFSAHGVAPGVWTDARRRRLHVIDATCPLVTKVHLEAVRFARRGFTVVLIGHRDHAKVLGTIGEAPAAIRLISSLAEADWLDVRNRRGAAFFRQPPLSVAAT